MLEVGGFVLDVGCLSSLFLSYDQHLVIAKGHPGEVIDVAEGFASRVNYIMCDMIKTKFLLRKS